MLALILVSAVVLNTAFAAITVNKNGNASSVGVSQGTFSKVAGTITKILEYVGKMSASGVFATITAFINILYVVLFLLLEVVFVVGTGDITHIPMPDTIIFNRFGKFGGANKND